MHVPFTEKEWSDTSSSISKETENGDPYTIKRLRCYRLPKNSPIPSQYGLSFDGWRKSFQANHYALYPKETIILEDCDDKN